MPPSMLGWMGCNGLVSTAAEPPLRSGQVRLPSAGMRTQEAFEGEREGIAYRQIVEETQRQMMSWFLPAVASRAFRQGLIGQGADTDVYRPLAQEKSAQATDLSA